MVNSSWSHSTHFFFLCIQKSNNFCIKQLYAEHSAKSIYGLYIYSNENNSMFLLKHKNMVFYLNLTAAID